MRGKLFLAVAAALWLGDSGASAQTVGMSAAEAGIHKDTLIASGVSKVYQVPAPGDFLAGKRKGASINVNYTGFSAEAKTAFQYAVDIWASTVTSSVSIVINANWEKLDADVLGSCGPSKVYYNFDNAPLRETGYPVALAEKLAGKDLNAGAADMDASFNSSFSNWYFGTDGKPPPDKYDLVSTILHELCHGLGFLTSFEYSGGSSSYGSNSLPWIGDLFMFNGAGQALSDIKLFANPSKELGDQVTSDNISWIGANAGKVAWYAPTKWGDGSSMSHVGEIYSGTPNALMTYSGDMGTAIHDPGDIVRNIFKDMGWTVGSGAVGFTVTSPASSVAWYNGETHDITWTSQGVVGNVTIDIFKAGAATGKGWSNIPNSGTQSWSVSTAEFPAGADYQVKISSVDVGGVYSTSAFFAIRDGTPATITISNPKSGDVFDQGGTTNIQWTSSGVVGNVNVEIYLDEVATGLGFWDRLANGSVNWSIPADFPAGEFYQIRVSSLTDPTIHEMSEFFSIQVKQYYVPTKISFSSSSKDALVQFKDVDTSWWEVVSTGKYSATATFDLSQSPIILESIDGSTPFSFVAGGFEFSGIMGEAAKPSFKQAKGGSATWYGEELDSKGKLKKVWTLSASWTSKKILTVKLTGTPLPGDYTNILDASGESDGTIDGNIDCSMDFADVGWANSLYWTGSKSTKQSKKKIDGQDELFDLVTWSGKASYKE